MDAPKPLSVSKNSIYNLVGTIVFCFCQWITSALLVVHLSPQDSSISNTGLLQLAISVTNIFFSISCYNMRIYQISDIDNKYSYGDYVGARIITAGIAVFLCAVYAIILGYPPKSIMCIMLYMIFKLNETFSDVLHAINQKNYRMDYVGISLCARGVISVVLFAAGMLIFKNVLIAISAMAIGAFIVVLVYDINKSRQFGSIKPVFNKVKISTLLISCLPAVVASSSFIAITSVPRQVLEGMRGEEMLGYYGTIATPLVVVQVMATSIFNPMFTQLAEFYNERKIREFAIRIIKNLSLLFCLAAFVCLCAMFFGKWAVGIVFGQKFVPYTHLMYGVIGSTTMYVVSWLCTNVLIIMRKLKVCMVASIIALVMAIASAKPFINIFDMNGVSFSIILAYIVHVLICSVIIFKTLKAKGEEA